jgi:hypothetical protein
MKRFILSLVAVIFCATAGKAFADDAAQKKLMHDYVLSMNKINAMQAMMDEQKSLAKNDTSFGNQVKLAELNGKTYASVRDKLGDIPVLAALYRKHGLTATDVVIMPAVLISAGIAAQFPSLAAKVSNQTSPAQIAFYKAHEAELHKIRWLNGGN